MKNPLVEIEDLQVHFHGRLGLIHAIDGVSLSLAAGESLGIVGESGSGKSVSSLALLGLLPPTAQVKAKRLAFCGRDLQGLSDRELSRLRGRSLAMIFQDPMTSLNPCFSVESQIAEAIRAHAVAGEKLSRAEVRQKVLELLKHVGIPDPEARLAAFPHQLSGGMSQRVMIAMAIACSPEVLIADEPTTALDVTVQAQILKLIRSIQKERAMGLILVSHDIGVIAENADRIVVMYAGQVVEQGPTNEVIASPQHPYTRALLQALPGEGHGFRARLPALPGMVPNLAERPRGCQFNTRCVQAEPRCFSESPPMAAEGTVRCFFPLRNGASV